MNHIRHMGHDSCICMWYQSELQPPSPIAQFRGTRHKPSSLVCQSRPSQSMHMKCDSTNKTIQHTHHNHISSRDISLYHNQLPSIRGNSRHHNISSSLSHKIIITNIYNTTYYKSSQIIVMFRHIMANIQLRI